MTQQKLIQRLKRQPKLGRSFLDDLSDTFGSFMGYASGALNAAKTLTEDGLKAAIDGFKGLNDATIASNVGLAKSISMTEALQTKFLEVAKAATFFEDRNKVLNKSFGISSANAEKLSKQFIDMAKSMSGTSLATQVSGESLMKYAGSIKKLLPTYQQLGKEDSKYYKGLVQSQHILQSNLGLTEEQANAFTQYAGANAENAAQQLKATEILAKAMGDKDGSLGFVKQITEGIAEAGSEIQLQYGRLPGSLERATIKASRLGLKLEDLSGTGENLLDIENSIGQELEYQLLTGRRLVNDQNQSLTNLYREATLRGDANKQADILTDIVKSEGKTLENNLFARKQMADLLGIQEQQLAGAIQKQKILDKAAEGGITINLDAEGSLEAAAAALKEQGALTAQEFEDFQTSNDTRTTEDLLKEQLTVANESLTLQKLTMLATSTPQTRSKLGAAATTMAKDGMFGKNLDAAALESLGKTLIALGIPQVVANELIDAATKSTTPTPGGLGGATTTTNDLVATPTGYGDRILLAGEDTFALNNDDTVVAGTNLFPQNTVSGNSAVAKLDELIKEIRNQTRVLSSRDNTFGAGINSAYYG